MKCKALGLKFNGPVSIFEVGYGLTSFILGWIVNVDTKYMLRVWELIMKMSILLC